LRSGGANFTVDRLLPICRFSNFLNLDGKIVGPGSIRMAAGATLIDALRQLPHAGNAFVDFLPEQHTTATRLGPLANDDFDAVRTPEIIRIYAVA